MPLDAATLRWGYEELPEFLDWQPVPGGPTLTIELADLFSDLDRYGMPGAFSAPSA